ncbi:glycine betaine/proline transport system substrate-binding protein [Paracoccus halophilus]|uniref:ABC transporter substrate-binding protein n=1 Tax=Paracoccus halophilus TaxID=376733 RepID=A0A099EYR4_9RHOB|nr:ABC transporter substrate-binding protein [Paracoccus halophilus]KGJ03108.1 ABC transporter substrate-binding protein [Paracoccus halophilus]SFA52982.1 glycine betaine/proline transport system substrate-binding protein [Paracoccus halophilus]
MRKILASTTLAFLGLSVPALAAEDCGRISIAEMNWASAGLAAWVDKIILEEGYGCEVALVAGDTMPTFTSMNEKAEPDMAPELWVNAVKEPLDMAVAEGRIVIAAQILTDGGVEGIWIPTWLAEKEGIRTLEDALARPELFPGAEDSSKGAWFGCPSGWACQLINKNQYMGAKADEKGFELVDTGSAAGLDGSIARAFNRQEGWLGYYWAPTAILGKYDMTRLDLQAEFDRERWDKCIVQADCLDPQVTEWPVSDVYTAVTREFSEKAGPAMDYVKARAWTNDTVNAMLSWMSENQASNEDGAYRFLETQEELWTQWVPDEVAEKVRSAL